MKIPIEKAIELLLQGQVVALPTETVYGLAAWNKIDYAIEKIFELKGRPPSNPLIVHIGNYDELFKCSNSFSKELMVLIERFWPGPLTIIVPAKENEVSPLIRANLPTVAIRMPNHPIMQSILQHVSPIVAPSANISGKPSSTAYLHVEKDFGIDFPVVDGGACEQGIESTIVVEKKGQIQIARLGAISQEMLAKVLGYEPIIITKTVQSNPLCPGQHFLHYAPNAKLILCTAFDNIKNSAIVGFSDRTYPVDSHVFYLGSTQDAHSVAHNLYNTLRNLDLMNIKEAFVDIDIPTNGIWKTIRERLMRASETHI